MRSHRALEEFKRFASERGAELSVITVREALDVMVDFYTAVRASDCDVDGDADMLLCQWGTHDWGAGRNFEFDVTRQLCRSGDDEDIWQLSLTIKFPPDDALEAVGNDSHWCSSPAGLGSYLTVIRAGPAFSAVGDRADGLVELDYECAG